MMSTRSTARANAVIASAILATILTGCGGSSTDLDAAAVVEQLAAQGLPITHTVTYTDATDPNKLLGRPGGYTSKAAFDDQRVAKAAGTTEGDVGRGGSVEVFADAGEAEERAEYISGIAKSSPLFAEYDYVKGNVVVRVSKELPPADAAAFEAALDKIVE
ncbi:hypothetical protein HS041_22305 [Planomonospora sp. ID67723]|uniref:hypothetical protein n=1 Tax=Planomonospora sp. ID67723 TaxID=2738134 RepID=UPI0018C3F8F2|nr:hypothetical protein [Planomonospora sp. ID67723]MBG0830497.1 hypothetical protein [Planomonospora sp. ID67723]